ncbi:MAG: hypothetical protein RR461_11215 [Angelakisella sp.]
MIINEVVYPKLEGKIAERGVRKCAIASSIGITPRALSNKLIGKSEFTWSQVKTIQSRFFPDISKDDLFDTRAG